ncbi:MAG: outer membrane protein assembly factor BamA [Gammaproteobacteria bacterium]|nr:outer membrane protein assembly factor BamA [Gammaproteobacteria bacterium]
MFRSRFGPILLVLALMLVVPRAFAFIVEDIELQGLQRLEAATVFTYLPVEVGEDFDVSRTSEVVRALFKSQLFSDVEVSRRGNVLVVRVVERPAITEIAFEGLEVIKDETLEEVLEDAGIATGRIFNQPLLDRLNNEILQQYHAIGFYNAEVAVSVHDMGENRVAVHINVVEGEPATIRQVHVVGNVSYTEERLLELFESSEPAWYDIMGNTGKYSKLQLSGDLERLRSFYLNRGFLKFRVDSAQISLSPDREGIYITVHINEGRRFVVREVSLSGIFIVPQAELTSLLTIQAGEYFSSARAQSSSSRLTARLGEEGYSFAKVNPVTNLDEEAGEVTVNFFIDPGQRVYVRRIDIVGNYTTQDEVLRRELRQMEGAWLSSPNLERSRRRLQRLPYIDTVEIAQTRVPGTNDQVDLIITVTERLAGNFTAGAGFSSGSGLSLAAGVEQENFFGTGNRVGIHFDNSETSTRYSFDFYNPYYTINGVSRSFGFSTRKVDTSGADQQTQYESRDFAGYLSYGIPIADDSTFTFAARFQRINFDVGRSSSFLVLDFLANNDGDCLYTGVIADTQANLWHCEATYYNLSLIGSFAYDTRDRSLFTREGSLRQVSARATMPGSGLEYYVLSYVQEEYLKLTEDLTFALKGEAAYGDGYRDTDDLPFSQKFVIGGPRSVRGFEINTLAPRDEFDKPYGGNLKLGYSLELSFPLPFIDEANLRGAMFLDSGYVFEEAEDFDFQEMRASLGIGISWLSPLGGVSMSLSLPINDHETDKTESYQFNLGSL